MFGTFTRPGSMHLLPLLVEQQGRLRQLLFAVQEQRQGLASTRGGFYNAAGFTQNALAGVEQPGPALGWPPHPLPLPPQRSAHRPLGRQRSASSGGINCSDSHRHVSSTARAPQQANAAGGRGARTALAALRQAAGARARRQHERHGGNGSSSSSGESGSSAASAAAAWARQADGEPPGDLARGLLALARLGSGVISSATADDLRACVAARLAREEASGMAAVSPVEAAALSLGLSRLADQSLEWRPVLQSATPGLVRRAAAGGGALTATQLTWALHAAGRAAGRWLFDGPTPCPAAALTDALAARLQEAAPLMRSGLGGSGWERSSSEQEEGEGGGSFDGAPTGPSVPRPNELSAASAALVALNYYSHAAMQALAECTVAAMRADEQAEQQVEGTAETGHRAAGLGAVNDYRRLTLVHLSRVLFACAKFDHCAPELVAAAARRVAASLQASHSSGSGGVQGAVRSNIEVRPLALIAWAVAILEPSRLDVARAVFGALASCSPPVDPQRPSSGKPLSSGALSAAEAPNARVLRQLSQTEAIAALAARAAGQAAPPQLPPLWRAAAAKAWSQGLFSGAGGASQTALAVAALLRRIGLDASLQQPTPDGRMVADIAVRYRGFTVALEVDGPNHFTAAPPSPSNAGGLFAAAPRRHHGDSRLRDLLLRANPGWLVAVVPWFDWRPRSRLPKEGGMPSHYFRARLDDAVAPLLQGQGSKNRPEAAAAAAGGGWLEGGQLRWWVAEVQEQLEQTGEWPVVPTDEAAAARGSRAGGPPRDAEAPPVTTAHQAERMAQWRELALQQLRWRRDADALLGLPQGGRGPR